MEFTVENICGLLIRSRLLAPEDVRSAYQRWLTEARDDVNNVNQFIRWLVANNSLTEYQGNLIAKGHADSFFLDQYKILDRLGRGRMAGVYKATHHLGQVVAIKVLPPSKSENPQMLARFQREARLALKLKHPNVVRSFQVGEANGLHYLVMEYLEGETLEDVLQRRKKLNINEAVRAIYQALLGLQHIYEQGMVHRDLKPANLMLVPAPAPGQPDTTVNATVKILDIGVGRELFEEGSPAKNQSPQLTGEGVLLGTPDYLAPEQARDPRSIDVRADIYSLGCVLYHTLTGQPPFPDTNILSQMVRHATEAPRPLRDFNPQVPDGLQQIINWMLAKQPEQRYATPARAAQALQMFMVADTSPPAADDRANMQQQQYQSWLDAARAGGEGMPEAAAAAAPYAPAAAAIPAAMPAAAPPVARPSSAGVPVLAQGQSGPASAIQKGSGPQSLKLKRRKSDLAAPTPRSMPVPTAPPAAAAPAIPTAPPATADVDVELFAPQGPVAPAPSPPPQGFPRRFEEITRRDWIFAGLGAGFFVLLELLILFLALLFRPSAPAEEEDKTR